MDSVDGGLDLVRARAATLHARAHDGRAFGDQAPVPEPSVLFGQADWRAAGGDREAP